MNSKNLHDGHRNRLRQRFLETNTKGFQEHELLELLLFPAIPRKNTNEISHCLIDQSREITNILDADISELTAVKGISDSSASFIKFINDLQKYYALSSRQEIKLDSHGKLEKYFLDYFSSMSADVFLLLSISEDFEFLGAHCLTKEELHAAQNSARRITEIAIRNNIHKIVIGQNCQERLPVPEEKDYEITRLFTETLTSLGIEIYDHILCGNKKTFSMRKNGAYSFTNGAFNNG